MYAIQSIATNNLLEEFQCRVIHNSHMVGIPTYRPADMKHQFRNEQQHRRYFVCGTFRRVKMSRIDSDEFLMLHAISHTELIRTYRIAFQADAEHFRLQTILHIFILRSKNPVERVLKQFTIFHTINRNIFAAIVHPKVHDTGIPLPTSHFLCNGTTTLGMLDPEITNALIGVRQRQVTTFRMRERC